MDFDELAVELVTLDEENLSEDLFQRALALVDPDAQARIKRFYHRADAWRTLIGRILPRTLLITHGIPVSGMRFGATSAGKPYILADVLPAPLAFNVSHDRSLIALASAPVHPADVGYEPAYRLGVDVMAVRAPPRESTDAFLASFVDQLGPAECKVLLAPPGGFAAHACTPTAASARLRGFFRVWTLKEAYTKALGAGVGFDFARLDLDLGAAAPMLRVDGAPVVGWALAAWEVNVRGETYVGALARFVGPGPTSAEEDAVVRNIPLPPAWEHGSASMFVARALESLEVKSITASRKDIKRDA